MFAKRPLISFAAAGFTAALLTILALPAQAEETCYQIGYRYGKCATRVMIEGKCAPEDDVVIPDRCKGLKETEEGTRAGTREVFRAHGLKPKE
ncbi:hypothetical protein [Desulfoferrobacter suflitae]|uniref:hypothetical protein n=1 Tax=Desulfoferrobacter suflitae TaxID=2865782 RepID=UPI0021644622|nr:hypothetical protein [Desulfoferrobacter suflitae]MCK8602937.1 hypothetical protein [Desulfoferrobacter suflitae]